MSSTFYSAQLWPCRERSLAVLTSSSRGRHNRLCIHRLAKPLHAINNQHSHVEEELIRMQAQLLVVPQPHKVKQTTHVFHDTEEHPYQRQPQRHVHHEPHIQEHRGQPLTDRGTGHDLHVSEHGYSYEYSSNIINYGSAPNQDHQEQNIASGSSTAPSSRPNVYRARVVDYEHPSTLSKDLVAVLHSGNKLLLELPDEPAAVSSLLTALGHASAKLRSSGLATALDPVWDPTTLSYGTPSSSASAPAAPSHTTAPVPSSTTTTAPISASAPLHPPSHDASSPFSSAANANNAPNTGMSGVPSSSADFPPPRPRPDGYFLLCARAVHIPPEAEAAAAASGAAASATPAAAGPYMPYSVGSSVGQEVLRVGPSAGVHALLRALRRAVLRDGLVTLRCCWFDEEVEEGDPWVTPELQLHQRDPHLQQQQGSNMGTWEGAEQQQQHAYAHGEPQTLPLQPHSSYPPHAAPSPAPPGSLVRVPGVLRAVFKLDRQLRSLELGGLVLLPHSFHRTGQGGTQPVLHLDVVIA